MKRGTYNHHRNKTDCVKRHERKGAKLRNKQYGKLKGNTKQWTITLYTIDATAVEFSIVIFLSIKIIPRLSLRDLRCTSCSAISNTVTTMDSPGKGSTLRLDISWRWTRVWKQGWVRTQEGQNLEKWGNRSWCIMSKPKFLWGYFPSALLCLLHRSKRPCRTGERIGRRCNARNKPSSRHRQCPSLEKLGPHVRKLV